jgi:membrane associated rhomboid family serine protease
MISVTLIIVVITCLISIPAFNNQKMTGDLIFSPPAVTYQREWYRFITCGFIHADIAHLAFNMLALYSFGSSVEKYFIILFGEGVGKALYAGMYLLALVVCLLPTYFKHRTNYNYRSLGASGAVSAVIFAGLLLEPRIKVGMIFVPIGIPGYIFGPLYLLISTYLARRGSTTINHSAHIWGALFGIVFIIVTATLLSDYAVVQQFIYKVRSDIGI